MNLREEIKNLWIIVLLFLNLYIQIYNYTCVKEREETSKESVKRNVSLLIIGLYYTSPPASIVSAIS